MPTAWSQSRTYQLYLLLLRCRWRRVSDWQVGFYPTRIFRLWPRSGDWPRQQQPAIFHWWAFGPLEVRHFVPPRLPGGR